MAVGLGIVVAGFTDDLEEVIVGFVAADVVVDGSDVDVKAVGEGSFSRISGSFKRSILEEDVEWVGTPF